MRPNASLWNIVCIEHARFRFALDMSISYCFSHFWVPKAKPVSGGIWASNFIHLNKISLDGNKDFLRGTE